MNAPAAPLGWAGIVRLGLVQTALGAIVFLSVDSTINRVMIVELALPAVAPGALVVLYYAVQTLRPRWGHGSDVTGRRTPWIVGGMATLALGGVGAALGTAWMASDLIAGMAVAILAYLLIGIGVGAAGTSLLALLAKRVAPRRRAAAATIAWIMMIIGFIITAATAGPFLNPFSPARLIEVMSAVCGAAFLITLFAVWGVERRAAQAESPSKDAAPKPSFRDALSQVWSEPDSRRFTIFVFVAMLAFSMQDLILEPFGGLAFGLSVEETTKLSGVQHQGGLLGMILVGVMGSAFRFGSLRMWTIGGCFASALALFGLAAAGIVGPPWPLWASVFTLGLANGAFAAAAIASMMELAGAGRDGREGVRMGVWGAAQGVASGLGKFGGAAALDVSGYVFASTSTAYAAVFAVEGVLFLFAVGLAAQGGFRRGDRVAGQVSMPASPV